MRSGKHVRAGRDRRNGTRPEPITATTDEVHDGA